MTLDVVEGLSNANKLVSGVNPVGRRGRGLKLRFHPSPTDGSDHNIMIVSPSCVKCLNEVTTLN